MTANPLWDEDYCATPSALGNVAQRIEVKNRFVFAGACPGPSCGLLLDLHTSLFVLPHIHCMCFHHPLSQNIQYLWLNRMLSAMIHIREKFKEIKFYCC